jgi:hypothetical protein
MANYNKSFNFRNGVQVDDDNFVVNSNGLVGIGSTIPKQALDVVGNINVSGFVTSPSISASNINVTGVGTIATLRVGIITSTNPGVTTVVYYGDGANLLNLPTSQWIDVNPGLGVTSIYAAGNVGVATTNPVYTFQVGRNPITANGIGFNSTGDIVASGIVTAGSFVGSGYGITSLNASNVIAGTLGNSFLPSNISVSGIVTATGGFVGSVTGNVTGTASTAQGLSGTPSISVSNITASNYYSTGILTSTTINGTTLTVTNVNSGISTTGISTVYTRLNAASIGVGTNSPSADVHIRDATNGATLQLTTDGNFDTYVSIGRSVTRAGNNGELRFGNTSGLYPYSTANSLDIINYGIGNVNSYLQLGSAGVGTGSFNWFYGQSASTPKMTFTYDGKLGIGITLPINQLHIVGTSTVTNNIYAGINIYAGNNLYVGNNLTVAGSFSPTTISSTFIGNLTGDVTSSGTSTFNQVGITTATIQKLGIGDAASTYSLEVGSGSTKVLITGGGIGIATNTFLPGVGLDASQVVAVAEGIGIGTTNPKCYADFSDAGTGPDDFANARFMLPPKVSSTDRVGLTTVEGAIIYNTTSKRLELYIGTRWVGVSTIA